MAPKKTNIKIKRSKINLYNKKKSKKRQALTAFITVVVICGLGVLGYGLGKPLLKYIQDRGNASQTDSGTSSLISSIIDSVNSGASSAEQSTAAESSSSTSSTAVDPKPPQNLTDKVYYLPDNAALSETSLASALEAAKKSGCSVVAVTLKDSNGNLLYKTSIAEVKDTKTVTGELTAAQIATKIRSEGLTPAARINTLMDKTGVIYTKSFYTFPPEQGGYGWHDDTTERGGKLWMSPFKPESSTYIGNIANELSAAGYKHIICVNTRYPVFHNVDINTYLNHLPLKDNTKRVSALWDIVTAAESNAEKNGSDIWLEMSASNVIAENRNCTDAEIITDKNKLKNVKITLNYDIKATAPNSSNTSGTSNTSGGSAPNGSAEYQNAKSFIVKAKTALGGTDFAVHLPPTLTGTAREDVIKAFTESKITVF